MEKVFICYKTDGWHSYASRDLIGVAKQTTNMETTVCEPIARYPLPEFTISYSLKCKSSELRTVSTSKDCAEVFRDIVSADQINWVEQFVMICLNRSNKVIGYYKVSSGGVSGTVADPRVIFQCALLCNACSIVLCHNHPSGNTRPSRQDEELTTRVKEAGRMLEIKVLDHIILTDEYYFSFADEGII